MTEWHSEASHALWELTLQRKCEGDMDREDDLQIKEELQKRRLNFHLRLCPVQGCTLFSIHCGFLLL